MIARFGDLLVIRIKVKTALVVFPALLSSLGFGAILAVGYLIPRRAFELEIQTANNRILVERLARENDMLKTLAGQVRDGCGLGGE